MARTIFSLPRRAQYGSRHPAPVGCTRRWVVGAAPMNLVTWVFHLSSFIVLVATTPVSFWKIHSVVFVQDQRWYYVRLVAYCYFGLCEGALGYRSGCVPCG